MVWSPVPVSTHAEAGQGEGGWAHLPAVGRLCVAGTVCGRYCVYTVEPLIMDTLSSGQPP